MTFNQITASDSDLTPLWVNVMSLAQISLMTQEPSECRRVWFKPVAPQKCPSLDTELTPPVRIKPQLLNLALKSLSSLWPQFTSPSPLPRLPVQTFTSCYQNPLSPSALFSGHPVPPMLSPRKALHKCLLKQRNKEDVHPTVPRAGLSLLPPETFLTTPHPTPFRIPSLYYYLVINMVPGFYNCF